MLPKDQTKYRSGLREWEAHGKTEYSDIVKYNYPESISNIVEELVWLKMVIFPTCFEYLEFLDSFTKITPTFTAQFYSKFPNEKKARRSEY